MSGLFYPSVSSSLPRQVTAQSHGLSMVHNFQRTKVLKDLEGTLIVFLKIATNLFWNSIQKKRYSPPTPNCSSSSTHISLVEKRLLPKTGMPKGQGAKLKKGEWGQSERVSWAEASKNA